MFFILSGEFSYLRIQVLDLAIIAFFQGNGALIFCRLDSF